MARRSMVSCREEKQQYSIVDSVGNASEPRVPMLGSMLCERVARRQSTGNHGAPCDEVSVGIVASRVERRADCTNSARFINEARSQRSK